MIIYNSRLPRWLNFDGMTCYPFIFIAYSKEACSKQLLEHEKIHIIQQKKYFFVGFMVLYFYDYVLGRIKGKNHYDAYRNIRFEAEAYNKTKNL